MTFLERRIDVEFRRDPGVFTGTDSNTVRVKGLRTSARISKAGGVAMNDLDLRVYGLPLSLMNDLLTIQTQFLGSLHNSVTVFAGDDETGMSVVFIGTMYRAWADMNALPNAVFTVEAHTGLLDALRPVAPLSIKGAADAAFLLSGIAQLMGLRFEGNGCSAMLMNPYYPGTLRDQALGIAQAAGFNIIIDDDVLAIWPRGGARQAAPVEISPQTGMIGYPACTTQGLQLRTLFNPHVQFGGRVDVTSEITNACGSWQPFRVEHFLESETPDGRWETIIDATVLGHTALAS